jgi:AcrR family transcriptional regulator
MSSNELGRRERKKLTTHRLLRSAALQLSAERGLSKVTVEDIAEAADVSVRTFYDHFATKEDAIVGFDASRVDQLREALVERPDDEAPLDSLRSVLRELLVESSEEWPLRMEVIRANPDLLPRMFSSFAVSEKAMIEVIASRTGTDPEHDLYPILITAVATGALRSSISVWRASGGKLVLSEVFDAAFKRVSLGLPAPVAPRLTSRRPKAAPRTPAPKAQA